MPGAARGGADSVQFRGEPIVYALTIPTGAPHPRTAEAFVRFVLSPEGQSILKADGFTLLREANPGRPGEAAGRAVLIIFRSWLSAIRYWLLLELVHSPVLDRTKAHSEYH